MVKEEIEAIDGGSKSDTATHEAEKMPGEYFKGKPDYVVIQNKLEELFPQISLSSTYKEFLQKVGSTDPSDDHSLFKLYNDFLETFGLRREEFQFGQDDDKSVALTLYNFFSSKLGNSDEEIAKFDQYGR